MTDPGKPEAGEVNIPVVWVVQDKSGLYAANSRESAGYLMCDGDRVERYVPELQLTAASLLASEQRERAEKAEAARDGSQAVPVVALREKRELGAMHSELMNDNNELSLKVTELADERASERAGRERLEQQLTRWRFLARELAGAIKDHGDCDHCASLIEEILAPGSTPAPPSEAPPLCPSRYCSKLSGHDDECDGLLGAPSGAQGGNGETREWVFCADCGAKRFVDRETFVCRGCLGVRAVERPQSTPTASASCPVCGADTPHRHSQNDVSAWLTGLVARWHYEAEAFVPSERNAMLARAWERGRKEGHKEREPTLHPASNGYTARNPYKPTPTGECARCGIGGYGVNHCDGAEPAPVAPAAEGEPKPARRWCARCPHLLSQHEKGFCKICECGGYLNPGEPPPASPSAVDPFAGQRGAGAFTDSLREPASPPASDADGERRCPFGCLQTSLGEPCICAGCRPESPPLPVELGPVERDWDAPLKIEHASFLNGHPMGKSSNTTTYAKLYDWMQELARKMGGAR